MGAYYLLFQILSDFVYGAGAQLNEFQELTLTLISTIGCLACVALPFVVVYLGIRFICGCVLRIFGG